MARVFIGVGTNEGDRQTNIARTVERLGAVPGIRVVRMAAIIETDPIGLCEYGRGWYAKRPVIAEFHRRDDTVIVGQNRLECFLPRGDRDIPIQIQTYGERSVLREHLQHLCQDSIC